MNQKFEGNAALRVELMLSSNKRSPSDHILSTKDSVLISIMNNLYRPKKKINVTKVTYEINSISILIASHKPKRNEKSS